MKITRIGHACVLLEGSKKILIDPFITDNPAAALTLAQIPHLDYIVCSHDHFDHFGSDVMTLAKRDGAQFVAIFDVTRRSDVVASAIETVGMNIGGTFTQNGISVSLTPAVHSATHGSAVGIVMAMDDRVVYHAGDTAVFGDMRLIPELFGRINVALLPIGGHFTMDEAGAAKAAKLLNPEVVVPIHYNTWPLITADTDKFIELCRDVPVRIVDPGDSFVVN